MNINQLNHPAYKTEGVNRIQTMRFYPSRRMFPPLRRVRDPTLLDIRIFNPQTRFNYICFPPYGFAASMYYFGVIKNSEAIFENAKNDAIDYANMMQRGYSALRYGMR